MAALVEILEVVPGPGGESLRGFSLERPQPPARPSVGTPGEEPEEAVTAGADVHAIELAGWALGREQRAVSIEVTTHDANPLIELPIDRERPDVAAAHPDAPGAATGGFHGWVGTLGLPEAFELRLNTVLEDDSRVELASLRGRRTYLRPQPRSSRLQPLMVTTLARTGSTILVRLLGGHPDVLAYRPFQYEPRVARYWTEILKTLAEPVSYLRQITHAARPNDRQWWLGLGSPLPEPLLDPQLQSWMGAGGVEELAALCRNRIDALYGQIVRESDRADARYFVEKYLPNTVPSLVWELYPDAREVILVRDFRDMICSMFAMNEKRGFAKFGRERVESDRAHIEQLGRTGVARLLDSWRRRTDRAHLVRYEDLILEPRRTLEALVAYLGLDSSPDLITSMQEALEARTDDSQRHRTSADPRSSIGRWQTDLTADLQETCETALGPALEAFGYRSGRKGTLAGAIG
jgi:hypothetical protein